MSNREKVDEVLYWFVEDMGVRWTRIILGVRAGELSAAYWRCRIRRLRSAVSG